MGRYLTILTDAGNFTTRLTWLVKLASAWSKHQLNLLTRMTLSWTLLGSASKRIDPQAWHNPTGSHHNIMSLCKVVHPDKGEP